MDRRTILEAVAIGGLGAALSASATATESASHPTTSQKATSMSTQATRKPFVHSKDGTNLYVQDWGAGRPIVLLAAWTFNSAAWGEHIAALTAAGSRCVALDRRGHGRSDAPCAGYDVDTLADDVAAVFEQHDLKDAILVAHSMGTIEAVRYLARHGISRVKKLVLIAPTTPFLRKTEDNPDAVPVEFIKAQYDQIAKDYAKWMADNEAPFFAPDTIADTRNWIKTMMLSVPLPIALECRRTISMTDTRKDLTKLNLPTLILHGDKDASAPLPLTGVKTAKLVKGSRLVVYEGAPHALTLTHRDRLLSDISAFIAS
jgi:pimeloyl-ACP methyl ester carboxylesterase